MDGMENRATFLIPALFLIAGAVILTVAILGLVPSMKCSCCEGIGRAHPRCGGGACFLLESCIPCKGRGSVSGWTRWNWSKSPYSVIRRPYR